jgi:hypothetical protein
MIGIQELGANICLLCPLVLGEKVWYILGKSNICSARVRSPVWVDGKGNQVKILSGRATVNGEFVSSKPLDLGLGRRRRAVNREPGNLLGALQVNLPRERGTAQCVLAEEKEKQGPGLTNEGTGSFLLTVQVSSPTPRYRRGKSKK